LGVAGVALSWTTVGGVKARELAGVAPGVDGATPADGGATVLPPDRVLAVGILRRNKTRLGNDKSFVPFAVELDVDRGTCSARFARERGMGFEITPRLPLPNALAELAASGPIQLATDRASRKEQPK